MAGQSTRYTPVIREFVDHDSGHWCNRCRLATGFRIWVAIRFLDRPMLLTTQLVCTECEGRDITIDPATEVA